MLAKLKTIERWKKTYLMVVIPASFVYLIFVVLGYLPFNFFALMPIYFFSWFGYSAKETYKQVDHPLEYIQFCEGNIIVGDTCLPIAKIRKVALEKDTKIGRFSLPFNHIKPGVFPMFAFPLEQFESLTNYIKSGMPHAEIVT